MTLLQRKLNNPTNGSTFTLTARGHPWRKATKLMRENRGAMKQYKPKDKIAGEYAVLKVFGGENQSGMGVVYLVQDREAPFSYILKTYQHKAGSENQRQFISEARAWINTGVHPNIVQAYWVREIDGQMYIAAEYIEPDEMDRNSLIHFLKTGLIREEVILQWAVHFCYGMSYALSKGVLVHRDIKPDNLMIDRNGMLKVTDFGLAKSLDVATVKSKSGWWPFGKSRSDQDSFSKTKTGSAMGTLPYISPEQFIDFKGVDHRADIYSFGIVLYKMVTGNGYPYRIDNSVSNMVKEFYRAHSQEKPIVIDSPLMPLISKCLEKKPELRYRGYDELVEDLRDLSRQLQIRLPEPAHVSQEDAELYAKAQSYVTLGDSNKALDAINEYTLKYPDNDCGWTEKGRIHYERKEYDQGITATRRSLAINPYNTHAWNNLGILLNNTKAPTTEIKDAYEKAIHFDPHNTAAMMNFVTALYRLQEFNDIPRLTVSALKIQPQKPIIVQKAQQILKELFDNHNIQAAKVLLSGWVEARPSDVDAWHNLGLVLIDQKEADRAIECFEKLEQLSPNDNFSVYQLSRLYFQKKQGKKCLEYCNKLIQRGHELLKAVSMKAQVMNLMGYYKQALDFLQPYIQHNPHNDVLWAVLSEIHESRDNYKAALNAVVNAMHALENNRNEHYEENMATLKEKQRKLNLLIETDEI
jgi:serine/threonine protein kinase